MSRVYWHSQHRTVELCGSERAWLGHIAQSMADAAWDLHGVSGLDRAVEIVSMIPERERGYLQDDLVAARRSSAQRLVSSLQTRLHVDNMPLDIAGHRLWTDNVALNTALVAGSDVVRLATKIHGWCEVHCWVDEPHHEWLASIIDKGLATGIYRRGLWYEPMPGAKKKWSIQGWENVLELLHTPDTGPVVMSYSVAESFPNADVAGWDLSTPPEWRPDWADDDEGAREWDDMDEDEQEEYRHDHAREAFYELSDDEQWDRAIAGLTATRPWAQITPDSLANVHFEQPVTIYDLFAPDRDERVTKAFQVPPTTSPPSRPPNPPTDPIPPDSPDRASQCGDRERSATG